FPLCENSSCRHALRITSHASQYLSLASSIDIPKVLYSIGEKPLPIAKFNRPPQRLSAKAYSSATISGWRNGKPLIDDPSRIFFVRCASAAMIMGGETQVPYQ